MNKHIAILRGINVGGRRKIKMADLKALLAKLNFENVITYIQSGNIVFESSLTDRTQLETSIAQSIHDNYGFDVPVIVRTVAEIQQIYSSHPFQAADTPLSLIHI